MLMEILVIVEVGLGEEVSTIIPIFISWSGVADLVSVIELPVSLFCIVDA